MKRRFITFLLIVYLVMLLMKELVLINENRFYVYQHRLVKDDSVICVGHGTGSRVKRSSSRNKAWNEITKNNAWYYIIVKDGMTKCCADKLEVDLINICRPIGNTKTHSTEPRPLNTEYIDNNYEYDESSPSGLRWKIGSKVTGSKAKAGDIAGWLRRSNLSYENRYTVSGNKQSMAAHRVVWYICTGKQPDGVIDHIDGNPCNNKIENLRCVTTAENNRNRKLSTSNKTGYNGVNFRDNCWIVQWTDGTSRRSNGKHFPCSKYGYELAKGLALEFRHRFDVKQAELGFSYSERHTGIYEKPDVLNAFTEEDITKMFECDLTASNVLGVANIYKSVNGKCESWTYKRLDDGLKIYRGFPIYKYGEELAKNLVIEFANRQKGCEPQAVSGHSLQETNAFLSDTTVSNNKSGIPHILFESNRNGNFVNARKRVNKVQHALRFKIEEHGLLESIAIAIRWLKTIKK